jgi:hypothetical protein
LRHADAALGEVGLQPARRFGLGKRHSMFSRSVASSRNPAATESCGAA